MSGRSTHQRTLVAAFRAAGAVRRSHTSGSAHHYDVAQHSWNALALLFALYPGTPSVTLIRAVHAHDAAERWVGDLPAPALWANDALRVAYEFLERQLLDAMSVPTVKGDEEWWLRGVDRLELYLHAGERVAAGERVFQGYLDKIAKWFTDNGRLLPKELREYFWDQRGSGMPVLDEDPIHFARHLMLLRGDNEEKKA